MPCCHICLSLSRLRGASLPRATRSWTRSARCSMSRNAKEGPTSPASVPRVEPDDRAPIGWRIRGRYRIVGELGAGAFGTVCLAEDEETGHGVAVRFLPRGLACPSWAAQPVQPLGRSIVAASTANPALVRVLELGEAENGQAFVRAERFPDGNGRAYIIRCGRTTLGARPRCGRGDASHHGPRPWRAPPSQRDGSRRRARQADGRGAERPARRGGDERHHSRGTTTGVPLARADPWGSGDREDRRLCVRRHAL